MAQYRSNATRYTGYAKAEFSKFQPTVIPAVAYMGSTLCVYIHCGSACIPYAYHRGPQPHLLKKFGGYKFPILLIVNISQAGLRPLR